MLGPIVRYREDEVYRRLHVFPFIFYSARHHPEDERTWWFILFPVLWLGHNDFLVFPLGGISRGVLGFDELLLVTPFYVRTRRVSRPATGPVTYTVRSLFWPLLSWGSDGQPDGRRTFRLLPLYGRTVGRQGTRHGFVMWPFYTWSRSRAGRSFHVWPFYGRAESPTTRQTTVFFPFYQRTRNYLTGGVDTQLWPFWRRAKGSDESDVRRFWPIYEYRRAGFTTTEYALWPFWRRTYVDEKSEFARYTWVVPFYRRIVRISKADGSRSRKTVVWPVGRWESMPDGGREVAIPVLSPFDAPALREFSEPLRPWISVYHKRSWPDGRKETSALFGLYMSRRTESARKVRLLTGLIGWDRDSTGRYLRLLWGLRIRVGGPR